MTVDCVHYKNNSFPSGQKQGVTLAVGQYWF